MNKSGKVWGRMFLLAVLFMVLLPFYWMIATSLKSGAEVAMIPSTLYPHSVHLDNYMKALQMAPFLRYFLNTVIVAAAVVLFSTIISILSAFAYARLDFPGKDVLFFVTLATMMIPQEMLIITNFKTIADWGWMNTYQALILPYCINASHIYLMRQNMKQIPNELYIAARIDGLTNFRFLTKVVIPQVKSSIFTSMLLSLIWIWNTFAWPNLVTTNDALRLISNGLKNAFTQSSGEIAYELQMAAATMVTIPLILAFVLFRKYILSGVTKGGIKG